MEGKDDAESRLQEELAKTGVKDQEQDARNISLEHTPPIPGECPDKKRRSILLCNPPERSKLQRDENVTVTVRAVTLHNTYIWRQTRNRGVWRY